MKHPPFSSNRFMWRTNTRKPIAVKDMTREHLASAIQVVESWAREVLNNGKAAEYTEHMQYVLGDMDNKVKIFCHQVIPAYTRMKEELSNKAAAYGQARAKEVLNDLLGNKSIVERLRDQPGLPLEDERKGMQLEALASELREFKSVFFVNNATTRDMCRNVRGMYDTLNTLVNTLGHRMDVVMKRTDEFPNKLADKQLLLNTLRDRMNEELERLGMHANETVELVNKHDERLDQCDRTLAMHALSLDRGRERVEGIVQRLDREREDRDGIEQALTTAGTVQGQMHAEMSTYQAAQIEHGDTIERLRLENIRLVNRLNDQALVTNSLVARITNLEAENRSSISRHEQADERMQELQDTVLKHDNKLAGRKR